MILDKIVQFFFPTAPWGPSDKEEDRKAIERIIGPCPFNEQLVPKADVPKQEHPH